MEQDAPAYGAAIEKTDCLNPRSARFASRTAAAPKALEDAHKTSQRGSHLSRRCD